MALHDSFAYQTSYPQPRLFLYQGDIIKLSFYMPFHVLRNAKHDTMSISNTEMHGTFLLP